MNNVVSTPITITRTPAEYSNCWQGPVANDISSPLTGWRELPFPESPLELSMTKEFSDDNSYDIFSDPAFLLSFPSQFQDSNWPLPSQDVPDLSSTLGRTSMSTTLPSDLPQSYGADIEGDDRGHHFFATSPSGPNERSRSNPRHPQAAPAQPRRVVSTEDLTPRSLHRMEAVWAPTLSGAVSPILGNLSDGDGLVHFTQEAFDMYHYVNVDHDQVSSTQGNPDRDNPSASPSSPVTNEGGHGKEFFDPGTFPESWVPGDHDGDCRQGFTRTGKYLTSGDHRPHSSSAYYGSRMFVPQPRLVVRHSPERQMVAILGPDPLIIPNHDPLRSDGPGDINPPPATGATNTQQGNAQRTLGASSVKPPRFRSSVGTKAMVEACKKRRKERGGARLFLCDVPGCSRDFTARHNLRYHMKSHNNIRDEICRDCGADFVTRETRRRHSRTCDGTKKRTRY